MIEGEGNLLQDLLLGRVGLVQPMHVVDEFLGHGILVWEVCWKERAKVVIGQKGRKTPIPGVGANFKRFSHYK
jgi:hypothetical protein